MAAGFNSRITEFWNSPDWKEPWKIIWSNLLHTGEPRWAYLAPQAAAYWKPPVMGCLPCPWEAAEPDTVGRTPRNWRTGLSGGGCLSAVWLQDVGGCQSEQEARKLSLTAARQWANHCCTGTGWCLQPATALLRPLWKGVVRPQGMACLVLP